LYLFPFPLVAHCPCSLAHNRTNPPLTQTRISNTAAMRSTWGMGYGVCREARSARSTGTGHRASCITWHHGHGGMVGHFALFRSPALPARPSALGSCSRRISHLGVLSCIGDWGRSAACRGGQETHIYRVYRHSLRFFDDAGPPRAGAQVHRCTVHSA
jgi:hypothetical protein